MKKVLFSILSLTTLMFVSCSNFLQGALLKEEIENAIELAKAESFVIAVNPLISESIVNLKPSENVEVKKGYSFTIEAKIHNDYNFVDWKVYSSSKGNEISDWQKYLKFSETETLYIGNETTKKVSVTVLEVNKDLEIVPYCKPKEDKEPPVFSGNFNVANSTEDINAGKSFSPAEFSANGNVIKKGGNKAKQLSFDFYVYDNDKPAKIWIKETPFFDSFNIAVDVLNDTLNSKTTVIDNCLEPYQKNVYKAKFNYNFQAKADSVLFIQVKVIDQNENISEETKSFIVSKDTVAGSLSFSTCTDDNNYYNRATAEKFTYKDLQEERKTIHWKPVVDKYLDFNESDGTVTEKEEKINSFELKYGFSEDNYEQTVLLQSQADAVFTHKTYPYNSQDKAYLISQGNDTNFEAETIDVCSYKLPDSLFEQQKDIYLCATVKDSVGNESTFKTILLAKPDKPTISYYSIWATRGEDGKESWQPNCRVKHNQDYESKYKDFLEASVQSISYRLFFSKESVLNNSSDLKVIKESSFYDNSMNKYHEGNTDFNKGLIQFNFAEVMNTIFGKYDEAKIGDVLGYYYLQAAITKNDSNFLASDLLEVPVIKGQIIGEPTNSLNLSDSDFNSFFITKKAGKIPDTPSGSAYYGFYHEIKIPDAYKEYDWQFYNQEIKFYDGERPGLAQMKYNAETKVYYFWQKENNATTAYAEAFDKTGNKVFGTSKFFAAAFTNIDYYAPTLSKDTSLKSIFPINLDYGNFTLSNYAGSGLKVVAKDDTGIAVDKNNNPFIDVQFLPRDIYSNRYTMWNSGYDTYEYFKLYERPNNYAKSTYHDFIIPLYLVNEGDVVTGIVRMQDSSSEKNTDRDFVGVFDWHTLENTVEISYENNKCKVKDTVKLNTADFDISTKDKTSMYSFTIEKYDTTNNKWEPEYGNFDYSKADTVEVPTDSKYFYRARSSNAIFEGVLNSGGYYHLNFTKPVYFFNSAVTTKEGFITQGLNALELKLTQPTLVQTYYANKNLGSKLSDWEMQATDVNAKVYNPVVDGTTATYYYDDTNDTNQHIPEGYYYIVACYFANGKKFCTSVMQK